MNYRRLCSALSCCSSQKFYIAKSPDIRRCTVFVKGASTTVAAMIFTEKLCKVLMRKYLTRLF